MFAEYCWRPRITLTDGNYEGRNFVVQFVRFLNLFDSNVTNSIIFKGCIFEGTVIRTNVLSNFHHKQ